MWPVNGFKKVIRREQFLNFGMQHANKNTPVRMSLWLNSTQFLGSNSFSQPAVVKYRISSDFRLPHTHEAFAWMTGHRRFLLISAAQDLLLKFDRARRCRKTCWRDAAQVSTLLFCPSLGVRMRPIPTQFAHFCSLIHKEEPSCQQAGTRLFFDYLGKLWVAAAGGFSIRSWPIEVTVTSSESGISHPKAEAFCQSS